MTTNKPSTPATKTIAIEIPADVCGKLMLLKGEVTYCGLKPDHTGDHRTKLWLDAQKLKKLNNNRDKLTARLFELAELLGYEVTKKPETAK